MRKTATPFCLSVLANLMANAQRMSLCLQFAIAIYASPARVRVERPCGPVAQLSTETLSVTPFSSAFIPVRCTV